MHVHGMGLYRTRGCTGSLIPTSAAPLYFSVVHSLRSLKASS